MRFNKIKSRNKIQWGLNSYEYFRLKPNYKAMAQSVSLISLGFILIDAGLSLIIGKANINPNGLRKGLRHELESLKDKWYKIKYRYLIK